MGLYEFHVGKSPPEFPIRKKDDVLQIVKRWEDGPMAPGPFMNEDEEIDWDQLEQDMHALAYVAMQVLPD